MFKPEKVLARPGWTTVPIKHKQMYDIHSSIILQPGPAALTDGASAVTGILKRGIGNSTLKVLIFYDGDDVQLTLR